MVSLADIEAARARLGSAIELTPCAHSGNISRIAGAEIFVKLENLQVTGSFKERGALNRLLLLTPEERKRGVIAASAGNHAQGLAYHAGRLGIPATIYMPEATPLIKASSTKSYGAKVVLFGANYDEANDEARRVQQKEGQVFVHPYDDEAVIAGQGTIGLEILEQVPDLDAIYVAIGGGGMIGGIAIAAKAKNPKIRIVGVETTVLDTMKRSLAAGKLVTLDAATTIADGIAVRNAGEFLTFPIAQKYVDEILTVDDEEIASAILFLLEREKTVTEGAGAAPLAALLKHRPKAANQRIALVLSGGNIDVNLISRIIERGLAKAGRLARLTIKIPDRPGALARLLGSVAEQRANVLEIFHNRMSRRSALGEVLVEVTLETRGAEHIEAIRKDLVRRGYEVEQDG